MQTRLPLTAAIHPSPLWLPSAAALMVAATLCLPAPVVAQQPAVLAPTVPPPGAAAQPPGPLLPSTPGAPGANVTTPTTGLVPPVVNPVPPAVNGNPVVPPPLTTAAPAPAAGAGAPPAESPGSAVDELGVELARRRQAEELAAGSDPNQPRVFRNQDQVPLSTLFLALAKQAQAPYVPPVFAEDPLVGFFAPTGIRPLDAFYAVAEMHGYKVATDRYGFLTLKRGDIRTPQRYTREIYELQHLNPFFALQPLAQSLGFQVKAPGQNSPSFPAPESGGGGGGALGGTTSGDDQSKPRFTPILPLDAPIYFRQHRGPGGGAAGAAAEGTAEESFVFVDRKQKAFVLYGTESEHRQMRDYLRGLDRPEKLIKVHTEIYRVNRNRVDNLGVDWSDSFGKGLTFAVNPNMSNIGNFALYPTGVLISYPNVSATLRALVQKGVFRSVASTDFLLRDGIPNTIRQVTEDPVVLSTGLNGSTTVNTGGTGGSTVNQGSAAGTTEVKTFYYGLSVDGVAFSMPGGKVDLNLNLALSNNTGDKNTSQGPIPVVQRNTLPVSAVIRPGMTCAFGGLVSGSEQTTRNAIPYLSKIPFLGKFFFASTTKNFSGDTLVVFATPFVIDPDETSRNPLVPEEQAAQERLRTGVSSFSSEVRRALPADGKEYVRPFQRPVTREELP